MKHVIMFSGGIGSWAAAKRVAERNGTDNLTLLFTDTLIEDADTYRFLHDAAENVGGQLVTIADGRTPWEVFHDVRFLGNSRVDPCSLHLKRALADRRLAHPRRACEASGRPACPQPKRIGEMSRWGRDRNWITNRAFTPDYVGSSPTDPILAPTTDKEQP